MTLLQWWICSAFARFNSSATREFWEIPVEGNVGMDQDPDKPFSGDNILVKDVVRVWKAGWGCLMNDMELDIGAGVDDSYYDLDETNA